MAVNKKLLARDIKRANTRLVALEKKELAGASRAYQYIFSEMPNRYGLTGVSKSGHLKFITSLKKLSETDLQTLRSEVTNFLKAKTSTLTGVKEVQKKMTENFKKQFGKDIYKKYSESKQYRQVVDNALTSLEFKSAFDRFGSEQVLQITREFGIDVAQSIFTKAISDNIETLTELYDLIRELE